jgi:acyl dehydratase
MMMIFARITATGASCGNCFYFSYFQTMRTKRWPHFLTVHSIHDDSFRFNCKETVSQDSFKQIENSDGSHNISDVHTEPNCKDNGSQICGTIPRLGIGLAVNQFALLKRSFSVEDVSLFASLVGDFNPIHRNQKNAATILDDLKGHPLLLQGMKYYDCDDGCSTAKSIKHTNGVIVHGMLVGSIFTAIIGTLIPGSVYLHQSFDFRRPVFTDCPVIGRIEVTKLRHFPRRNGLIMQCQTMVYDGNNFDVESNDSESQRCLVIRGQASVWIPNGALK